MAKLFLFALGIAVTAILPAEAGQQSDIELLRLAAMTHMKNRDKLSTWQGHAQIEETREGADGVVMRQKSSIRFLCDCRWEMTRWQWTIEERYVRERPTEAGVSRASSPRSEGETPSTRKGPDRVLSGLKTRLAFCRYAPDVATPDGRTVSGLAIWPPDVTRGRPFTECFEPMSYLSGHMTLCIDNVVERLLLLYRGVKSEQLSNVTATRDGDCVILRVGDEAAWNRHRFDLSQGGNVVEFDGKSDNGTERRQWTYELQEGAWIPKTFVLRYQRSAPDALGSTIRIVKVTFVENVVNHPLAPSEFSLQALGLMDGASVTDERPGYSSFVYYEKDDERLSQELQGTTAPLPSDTPPLEFAEALAGKPLPDLRSIGMEAASEPMKDQCVLVCFWDFNQRPARHWVQQLARQAGALQQRDVAVLAAQIGEVESDRLKAWAREQNIPFPIGTIEGDIAKVRFTWAVQSLPWLILTDARHVVRAEGFDLTEVDDRIKSVEK